MGVKCFESACCTVDDELSLPELELVGYTQKFITRWTHGLEHQAQMSGILCIRTLYIECSYQMHKVSEGIPLLLSSAFGELLVGAGFWAFTKRYLGLKYLDRDIKVSPAC